MHTYKGKAKCSCGKRAKWRVQQISGNCFACEKHKEHIEHLKDDALNHKEESYTEADYQTWLRL